MVDKMSKFSRGFISLNSLSQIVMKNKQRVLAKAMIRWTRNTSKRPTPSLSSDHSRTIADLESQLAAKDAELLKMNDMFREYSTWRTKLEQIEGKMRTDVEFWKQAAEKGQRDNERAQREAARAKD
jgi:hypothetical protein